jgi:PAS domain S-box-containing protein
MRSIISKGYLDASWLHSAMQAGGMSVWLWDLQTDEIIVDEMHDRLTGHAGTSGMVASSVFFDRIHPDDREEVRDRIEQAMKGNVTFQGEFRYLKEDGNYCWLGSKGDSVAVDGESFKHFAGVNWDITSIKEAEKQAEYVAREMAHRVKNIIAMINGISRMTAKSSANLDEYQEAFGQRLQALAGVNQLILGNETRRASLENLVEDTLHSVNNQNRITIRTSDFETNEKASQTLVLALNELATNAVKYGALQDPDGTVDLQIITDEDADLFELVWTENRERPIEPASEAKGFGSTVLLQLTKSTFQGEPSYEWRENGMTYRCQWQASLMSL